MKTWTLLVACLLIVFSTTPSDARRTHLTAEQKAQLERVQTVFVNVLTLTEKGSGRFPLDHEYRPIQDGGNRIYCGDGPEGSK